MSLDHLSEWFDPDDVTTSYATVDQFRKYIRDDSGFDTDLIILELAAASRSVDAYTSRHFYQHVETRYFSPHPNDLCILRFDDVDLATTTSLAVHVDTAGDGTYTTTRTITTEFVCEPVNRAANGLDAWPITKLRAVGNAYWPRRTARRPDTVKVAGTWGWPSIPSPVLFATLLLTAESFKMADAPFGYVGFGNFGTARVQNNPKACALLNPYRRYSALVG